MLATLVNKGESGRYLSGKRNVRAQKNRLTFDETVPFIFKVAGWTRLELATSCVTGRRSNQLNYHPLIFEALVRQFLSPLSICFSIFLFFLL